MPRRVFTSATMLGLLLLGAVQAGQFNPTLSIGDPAPAWSDLLGVDDEKHSLDDLKDKDVVIVVFTCNSCPYAVDYQDRLVELGKEYANTKVGLVAINVNTIPEDNLEAMKARAKAKSFNFAYLHDPSQKIAQEYGATYTPEFFVLDKDRKLAYMGAMDDSADPKMVKAHYLEDAVQALLGGEKPAKAETPAVGCGIRYARMRHR